jgi:hypothetical protein
MSQTATEIRTHLAENLSWRFAERDDQAVAQALYQGEAVDAVHTLDEVGLVDGFFAFLEASGVFTHWRSYTIAGIYRVFLPALYFLLLYGTRILFGIASSNALPELLFSNVAVMQLIGFNAHAVVTGLTRRGAAQRSGTRPYALLDPQTLAQSICKTSAAELARLFNGTIRCLAAWGIFPAEVMAGVDGTKIVTTAKFAGCGCLKVKQQHRNRQGVWVETFELVYGWRLIALIDLVTLIPLAIKIVQIQEHEAPHLRALVQQAQANLAPHSRIRTLVVDRAYVDGPTLYTLTQDGLLWYLVAKSNMVARHTAIALSAEGHPVTRTETVTHGHGREATMETLVSTAVAVTGIRTWENYRPPTTDVPRLAWADRPALNAVVLTQWRNQAPTTDGSPRVILTNAAITDLWQPVDAYDDRSWIENGLFRNSKQFWTLTRWFPEKSAAGVCAHLTFVMLMVATATAYRLWDKAQATAPLDPEDGHPAAHLACPTPPTASADVPPLLGHHLLQGQGPARWRRELRMRNRDKLIVFSGERYGIFDTHEFMILAGVPLQALPPHLGTPEDILRRFGCLPPDATSAVKVRLTQQDTIP